MTFDEWWEVVLSFRPELREDDRHRKGFAACWEASHLAAVEAIGSAVEDRLDDLRARVENLEAENAVLRESVPVLKRAELPSVFCDVCHAELTGDPHYHCPACGELCTAAGCFTCHGKDEEGWGNETGHG